MAYERSLVKKLQGLPVQILGINLDGDNEETHARCVKEGFTWPSIDGEQADITSLNHSAIPQFYLVDSKGVVRFETAGAGSNFEVKFMRKVEELLAEMGHEIELVNPDAKAESKYISASTIRRASSEIFGRLTSGESVDQQFLKEITPKNLGPDKSDEFFTTMLRIRSDLALRTNHPQSREFIREFSEADDAKQFGLFADDAFDLSQQFKLSDEVLESCLEISRRAAKLDPSPSHLEICAKWLAIFPERTDEAIKMHEKAILVFREKIKAEDGSDTELSRLEKLKLEILNIQLSILEEGLEELKAR